MIEPKPKVKNSFKISFSIYFLILYLPTRLSPYGMASSRIRLKNNLNTKILNGDTKQASIG